MSNTNFPYTQSYKKIPEFFEAIQKAVVPEKFTTRFLAETLKFKGTNDRPLTSILKSLDFIDVNGAPTEKYFNYKNKDIASAILGKSIKNCYSTLYQTDEEFHKLSDDKIKGYFESTTGKESKNKILSYMTKTFIELKNLARFDEKSNGIEIGKSTQEEIPIQNNQNSKNFVLSHTIVVNLPSTTDQKVYDVLFKSMKENLL